MFRSFINARSKDMLESLLDVDVSRGAVFDTSSTRTSLAVDIWFITDLPRVCLMNALDAVFETTAFLFVLEFSLPPPPRCWTNKDLDVHNGRRRDE